MNIAGILEHQAEQRPGDVALIDAEGRSTTFRDLWEATSHCAAVLYETGLRQRDGVLLFHPMATDLYVFLIALFRIGAVGMVMDPSSGAENLERCCEMWAPKAFFGSPKAHLLRLTNRVLRHIPLRYASGWFPGAHNIDATSASSPPHFNAQLDDPALVTFTSGSTGRPKAAVRSHGFLIAQYEVLKDALQLAPGRVDLTTLPIFVLANLAAGVTSVLPNADMRHPGDVNAQKIVAQVRSHSVESTGASPAFIARLVDHLERTGERLPQLKEVFVGGAPVFPNLLKQCAKVLPDTNVVAVYGSTEAEPMAEITRTDISETDQRAMASGKGLLAGRPVNAIQLRIIRNQWGHAIERLTNAEFSTMHQSPGSPGEIVVAGAHVLRGYLNGEGDEETKFDVDGLRWHRTGDLGYLDHDCRLWLLGRCAARIEDSRGTLYPFSVECAAMDREEVKRAALMAHHGRRVLAVQFRAGRKLNEQEVKEALAWAQLDEIVFLDCIPTDKRHNAKVDYPALIKKLR